MALNIKLKAAVMFYNSALVIPILRDRSRLNKP